MKSVAHFDICPYAEYDILEAIKEFGKNVKNGRYKRYDYQSKQEKI